MVPRKMKGGLKRENMKLYNQLTTIIRRLTEAQTDAQVSKETALFSICREDYGIH